MEHETPHHHGTPDDHHTHDHPTHDHAHDHAHDGPRSGALAEMLDLDAEVLASYLAEITGWVAALAAERPRRRVLDLGAGTGTGTVALAGHFPDADLTALDASAPMLDRVRQHAAEAGITDRVTTVQADLDAGWPEVEPFDLVWAASSLHEVADPAQVFRDVFAALNPGGMLAVVEMEALPRFLPDDIGWGRPGLEARCHAVLDRATAGRDLHPEWSPRLTQTGFTVLGRRSFSITPAPTPAAAGRYARAYLSWIRPYLEDELAGDDLVALDRLLDDQEPDGLLRRTDLVVRGSRTVWIARRP